MNCMNRMSRMGYRYRFASDVQLHEAKKSLLLAVLAAEGLFGRTRVRMDSIFAIDKSINVLVIDAGTIVGTTISLIFTSFLTAEFGDGGFDVRQVEMLSAPVGAGF